MKKILVINTVDYLIGGMSTVIMNYFENIEQSKYKMEFVINDNINERYRTLLNSKGAVYYNIQRRKNPISYFFKLMSLIRKNKFDIVHIHGNSCTAAIESMAAKLGGCRNIIVHSHNSTCTHTTIHKLLRPFLEISCNRRLACSKIAGEWMFRKKKFTIIENALNLDKYIFDKQKRIKYRSDINAADGEIVVGHVGLFNEQKNHKFLLKLTDYLVHKKNEKVKLMLVGEGELLDEIKEQCKTLNIENNVVFFGTTNDIPGVMSAMDVFVFPSNWEGLGIVFIEAQLMGLPSIASTAVPFATRITEECRYADLSSDISVWAEYVTQFGKKTFENKEHSLNLINLERYDMKCQISKLEHFYDCCK